MELWYNAITAFSSESDSSGYTKLKRCASKLARNQLQSLRIRNLYSSALRLGPQSR